ncbi:MAG: phosphomannose isomerase type II C-terminal cupin domain [Candidatus Marsarchaeota archaeon]|jgi:mannose-6-phosphate isomerase-like protein (cupin superfamily)|nr:phosphomannose isomerase type II C-terminal cupin domain [Candidatus Marsarchaeota archaeon]MCL5111255.1 phosphomannose isomerase type II C-terminal cupin domain [Candidatus Marsarchaeota archaeon]
MAIVTDARPWGSFKRFNRNRSCTVKLVRIKPGKRNSLQYHLHRREFWYIVDGTAKLRIGNSEVIARPGDYFTIPARKLHRWGATKGPVTLIEISYGRFDEGDIVRLEDDFGRR